VTASILKENLTLGYMDNEKKLSSTRSKVRSALVVGGFSVSGLILAFYVAWLVMVPMNFNYGLWHDVGGIGAAIEKAEALIV